MTGTGDSEAAAVQPVEATDARDAATVLRRLERIEALDRAHAPAGQVLGELRKLVREAEAWARCEGDERARAAVGNLREEAEGMR